MLCLSIENSCKSHAKKKCCCRPCGAKTVIPALFWLYLQTFTPALTPCMTVITAKCIDVLESSALSRLVLLARGPAVAPPLAQLAAQQPRVGYLKGLPARQRHSAAPCSTSTSPSLQQVGDAAATAPMAVQQKTGQYSRRPRGPSHSPRSEHPAERSSYVARRAQSQFSPLYFVDNYYL